MKAKERRVIHFTPLYKVGHKEAVKNQPPPPDTMVRVLPVKAGQALLHKEEKAKTVDIHF